MLAPDNDNNWPPQPPLGKSVDMAKKIFFKHLKEILLTKVKTPKGKRHTKKMKPEDVTMEMDVSSQNTDAKVVVFHRHYVRLQIDDIFAGENEVPMFVEPTIVVEAFNTLPDDLDLHILADHMAGDFLRERKQRIGRRIEADEKSGKLMEYGEKSELEESERMVSETIHALHASILARTLLPSMKPKIQSDDSSEKKEE